jgi:tRNA A37 methylthiotransferase MiaB
LKKVALHTLGCKLNFSETSTIAREFSENGFRRVKFGEEADVVVINTCTVTGIADKKCRAAIKKAKKSFHQMLLLPLRDVMHKPKLIRLPKCPVLMQFWE